MTPYTQDWDLTTIPDAEWNSEHGRRRGAKRVKPTGGARPGAGRPRKVPPTTQDILDAVDRLNSGRQAILAKHQHLKPNRLLSPGEVQDMYQRAIDAVDTADKLQDCVNCGGHVEPYTDPGFIGCCVKCGLPVASVDTADKGIDT